MTASEHYIKRRSGCVLGPLSADDIRQHLVTGRMKPQELVSVDGGPWRPASEHAELVDEALLSDDPAWLSGVLGRQAWAEAHRGAERRRAAQRPSEALERASDWIAVAPLAAAVWALWAASWVWRNLPGGPGR